MTNKIEFTETAKKEISRIISRDTSKKYFRISVLGGGCSGFKYNFSFEDKVQDNDRLFDQTVIDNNSLKIIEGSIVDFKKELIGNSFTITNPKAKSTSMHMINENHLKKNILFNIKENKKIIDMYKYVCNFIENKDALKNIYIDYFTPMKVNSNLNTFPELIKFSIKNLFSIVINKLVFLIPKLNIKFVRIILSNLYLFNFIYIK